MKPIKPFHISLNLPNQLTLGRLGLCALFVAAIGWDDFAYSRTVALVIFIVASLTDWLDGEIARRYNLVTDLGKLLDPLADKILISAAFIGLIDDSYGAPIWMVVAIIAREFLITGLRVVAAQRGYILAAEKAGKNKTITQVAFVIVALVLDSSVELDITPGPILNFLDAIHPWLLWLALAITVVSGVFYFWKNRGLFAYDEDGKEEQADAPPAPTATLVRPAFKEWQAVVAALGTGRQALILRKGGIAEGKAGFQVKHKRFWLLPTRFHEQGEKLKEGISSADSTAGDAAVSIEFFAEVTQVAYLQRWEEAAALDSFHIWKPETIRERFDYKEPGLHCFLVRVYRLREPATLAWSKEFDGCKSWVEIPLDWETRAADPVLDDAAYSALKEKVTATIRGV